jgi:tRNA(Leu) C34 or U34 (ribose-2'-O)-methylase TrmL
MRGFAAVGLFHPKTEWNVGGVLRAAQAFDARLVAIEGVRYKRAATDTTRAYKHIPLVHGTLHDLLPYDCVPVAVDLVLNARSLHSYTHPERAFYVFGPEDSTLGVEVLQWCRDVVYIPTRGCLNLAACVNVVLYDRSKKMLRDQRVLDATKRDGWKKVKTEGEVL